MPSVNMAAPADTFHSNEQHKANPFRLAQLPSDKQHAVFIVIGIILDHIGWWTRMTWVHTGFVLCELLSCYHERSIFWNKWYTLPYIAYFSLLPAFYGEFDPVDVHDDSFGWYKCFTMFLASYFVLAMIQIVHQSDPLFPSISTGKRNLFESIHASLPFENVATIQLWMSF